MSLTTGWNIARSALSVAAEQTAVASRNVGNSDDPLAARRSANVVTAQGGGVRVASITRSSNEVLFEGMLRASSVAGAGSTVADALDRLNQTVGDPASDTSPAALIGRLGDALQLYSSQPQDQVAGQAVLGAAEGLTVSLNDAARAVREVRGQADNELADIVERINTQLSRFEALNSDIVSETRRGADVTDALEARDGILAALSENIGLRIVPRADNDLTIYTDSGVTMFETRARTISFQQSVALSPGVEGNAVFVDGVPVTGDAAVMPITSGRIAGLVTVRDEISQVYQSQIDEVARGLVEVFAERDQGDVPTLPDVPGLFTFAGAAGVPASGEIVDGLAGFIEVNANVDPARGGDVNRLRDGGISEPGNVAYIYNETVAAGYSGRLLQLFDALGETRSFDAATQISSSSSLAGFASSSVGWLQETRQTARDEASYRGALAERTTDALSRETGVNLDEEMINLLDLERSYQASSRLLATIDAMYGSLFAAAG